jgi:hypothetical protein
MSIFSGRRRAGIQLWFPISACADQNAGSDFASRLVCFSFFVCWAILMKSAMRNRDESKSLESNTSIEGVSGNS